MPTILQWVKLLERKITDQTAYASPFERRYQNSYVLPFLTAEYAEVYGKEADRFAAKIRPPRSGMAGITVDAITDRLNVVEAIPSGLDTDLDQTQRAANVVKRAWIENDLDVMHREAHREALIKARSFVQVGRRNGRAVVGIESAEQVAVHREQEPPYSVDGAMKIAVDEWTGKRKARLWLLEAGGNSHQLIDLVEGDSMQPDPQGSQVSSRWVVSGDPQSHSGAVPVVEFQSRPRLLVEPTSEVEAIESLVDIVDLADGLMVFAGHFGAVPIRWAKGLDVPRDPKDPSKPLLGPNGKPVIGFDSRADRLWVSTSKEAQFGQLEPAALSSFVVWAEHATSRIRAKSQVASTYYSMDLKSHMSAELLKVDEAPMVRRLRAMGERGSFGHSWRRVMRLMLAVEQPDLAGAQIIPRWEDPATRIEALEADQFSKLAPHLDPEVLATEVLRWSPERAAEAVKAVREERARQADLDPYEFVPDDVSGVNVGLADTAPVG